MTRRSLTAAQVFRKEAKRMANILKLTLAVCIVSLAFEAWCAADPDAPSAEDDAATCQSCGAVPFE